jgi:hypothetical protein
VPTKPDPYAGPAGQFLAEAEKLTARFQELTREAARLPAWRWRRRSRLQDEAEFYRQSAIAAVLESERLDAE